MGFTNGGKMSAKDQFYIDLMNVILHYETQFDAKIKQALFREDCQMAVEKAFKARNDFIQKWSPKDES